MKKNWSSLAFVLFCSGYANAQEQKNNDSKETEEKPSVDWLVADRWHSDMRDGLLTLNTEDLTRFVPTGTTKQKKYYGFGFAIINNAAVFYGDPNEPEEGLDQPASIYVIKDGKLLAGAKGYDFDVEINDELIIISHWNGTHGCTISKWWLSYDFEEKVEFIGSEYLESIANEPCKP